MDRVATAEDQSLKWALPGLDVPADQLCMRLDIHNEAIILRSFREGATFVRPVSALDVARALAFRTEISSGILPPDTIWWQLIRGEPVVGLWRPPRLWKLALQLEAFAPPRRFKLPMPGLLFFCRRGQPPSVFASEKRPTNDGWPLYHAPLFNVFRDGRTCQGTHEYPDTIQEIPESFMTSFFTIGAHPEGRSKKYPDNLLKLWEELNGKKHYPLKDLMPAYVLGRKVEGQEAADLQEAEEVEDEGHAG